MIPLCENKILLILKGVSNLGRWRCSKELKSVREISKKGKYRQQTCTVLKGLMTWKQRERKCGWQHELSYWLKNKTKPVKMSPRHWREPFLQTDWGSKQSNWCCLWRNLTKTNVFWRIKGPEQTGSIGFTCSAHLNTVHFFVFGTPTWCVSFSQWAHTLL